jgi:hypothetical protein
MGNYSKDPDAVLHEALAKGYDSVRFQQGKPILDRELNLLADLASPRRLAPYIGNGVPAAEGLWVDRPPDPTAVSFFLMPGRCMVGGLELVIADKVNYTEQPHKGNLKSSWPVPGGTTSSSLKTTTTGTTSVLAPTGGGTGYVYLRVFRSEVDDTADAGLQNQQDIGFETSLRSKVDWELLLLDAPVAYPDHFLLVEYEVSSGVVDKTAQTVGTTTTTTTKTTTTGFTPLPPTTKPGVIAWNDRRVLGLTLEQVRTELDALALYVKSLSTYLNTDGSFKTNAVDTATLRDLSVTTQKLANGAVNSNKLGAGAVGNAALGDLSVGSTKLQDNAVTNTKIFDGSVGNTKLANNAVDGNKIAGLSVATGHIQNAAVTNAKIAAGSVTVAQLKFSPIASGVTTISAHASIMFTLMASIYQNQDNFIVYSLWGNGDFTWSEFFSGGNRMLKIQNNASTPLTLNYMIRRIAES